MSKLVYKARVVPIRTVTRSDGSDGFPCCCAPRCGDKIKPFGSDDTMIEIVDPETGQLFFLEDEMCVDWFENGHPDGGGPYGKLEYSEKNDG